MKKTLIYALFSIVLAFCSEVAYCKEVKLETDIHWLSHNQLDARARNFLDFFKGNPPINFSNSYDRIPMGILKGWNKDLGKISNPDNYIHVLRVMYGLNAAKDSIILIYLPDHAIEGNTENVFVFNTTLSNTTPVYFGPDFTRSKPYSLVSGFVTNYQQSGSIILNQYGVPGAFSMATPPPGLLRSLSFTYNDVRDDAKGIVFSFQEILNFFDTVTGDVYVVNAASHAEQHGVNFFKHGIAFSYAAPCTTATCSGTGVVNSADLGALCPPRCNEINVVPYRTDWLGRIIRIVLPLFVGVVAFWGGRRFSRARKTKQH